MNRKRFLKNIAVVAGGNAFYLLGHVLTGFLVPLILPVDEYGYYKVYTLYISYYGLLNFGFVDGLLLQFAGMDYDQLDRKSIRRYTRFFWTAEAAAGCVITLFALVFLHGQTKMILVFVAIGSFFTNVTLYYQYLSQAVSRFKEFSLRKIFGVVCSILALGITYAFIILRDSGKNSFVVLIASSIFLAALLLLWYIYTYREVSFGAAYPLAQEKKTIFSMIKKGLLMTAAYEAYRFMLLLDRQFVSLLFDIETYARYAFAYNILSSVTAVVTSVSTVLFPALRKMEPERAMQYFPDGLSLVSGFACLCLAGFYPLKWLIQWILPKYIGSIVYLQIVFPVLALSGSITIIIFTYYKILEKNFAFMLICLGSVVIAALLNAIAYHWWGTPEAISIASIASAIIWYLWSVLHLWREYRMPWIRIFCHAMVMTLLFYASTLLVQNEVLGLFSYLLAFAAVTFAFYHRRLGDLILKLRKAH